MPTYSGISSEAFRHPLDQQAEASLRSVPGFDLVASRFMEFIYERPQYVYLMGNSIQVGPRQYPTLHRLFQSCVRDLDLSPIPALFVAQSPEVNSYSFGQEQPCVVVNTGLLDLVNQAELRAVLAHELGHVKCGHSVLSQMAIWTMNMASAIGEMTFGLGNLVSSGLVYAFYEWRRKAELSADRAALLVTDDLPCVIRSMMQIAGMGQQYADECSLEEFVQQSEAYHALDQDGLNQVYKFLLYNGGQGTMLSHPFPVERVRYLREWAASEEYQQILRGNYLRSQDIPSPEPSTHSHTSTTASTPQADALRQQIEELQQQIDQIKSGKEIQ